MTDIQTIICIEWYDHKEMNQLSATVENVLKMKFPDYKFVTLYSSDYLYKALKKKINRIMPLDYSSSIKGFKCENRWKIIENKNLEIEL